MKDSFKHQGRRKQLVELLASKGITDQSVLEAMNKIPRHLFLDSGFEDYAYQDKAFPIGAEQTISQPYTVAYQTSLLELKPQAKVLEIGTGSGYQTAVLSTLNARVYSVERQFELYKKTRRLLTKLGYKTKYLGFGDGYKGLEEEAPFDAIIVTAGAPFVPKALLAQLKVGGRLVIPVGHQEQTMNLFIRKDALEFEKHELGEFKFVPMLEDKN